jgi:hypothetical protein
VPGIHLDLDVDCEGLSVISPQNRSQRTSSTTRMTTTMPGITISTASGEQLKLRLSHRSFLVDRVLTGYPGSPHGTVRR